MVAIKLDSRILAVALLSLATAALAAGTWPSEWILINTDPADQPAQRAPVDVVGSYYNYDSAYFYLRLNTVDTPAFTPNAQKNNYYKWLVDDDNDAYVQGNQFYNAEYVAMVRDMCDAGGSNGNDGAGEYYIFGPSNTSDFSDFGACSQSATCANCADYRLNDTETGDFRIVPYNIDMHFSWARIGGFGFNRSFWWATGHDASSNLNQIGNDNSEFGANVTPFIPLPHLSLGKSALPSSGSPGDLIAFTLALANDGQANLSGTSITDFLPAQMAFSACSDNCTVDGQTVIWNYSGTFESGSTWTVFLNATINSGAPDGILTNYANASGSSTYTNETSSASANATVTVGNTCGIDANPAGLDYGSLETGQTSGEVSATVNNTGTAATTSLTVQGGNWTAGGSSFSVSQTRYSTSSGQDWSQMTALSENPATLGDGTLAPGEAIATYYRVRVPLGQASGNYSQDVTFTAVC